MSVPTILRPCEVNEKELKFIPNKDPKPTIKNFLIGYGLNSRGLLHVQFPECEAFSLSSTKNPLTGTPYNEKKMSMTIKMPQDRKSCKDACDMLNRVKNRTIEIAADNSVAIFGKKRGAESIADVFTDMVRYSKKKDDKGNVINGEFNTDLPPLISFPVYKDEDGKIDLKAESASGKPICLDNRDIKGSYVTIIARFNGIWTNGSGSGMTWRIIKARVIFVSKPNKNIAFLADEDRLATEDNDNDDDVDAEYDEMPTTSQTKKIPQRMNMIDESEDEEEVQNV